MKSNLQFSGLEGCLEMFLAWQGCELRLSCFCVLQLLQAQNDQFNMRAHVEYEWHLVHEDMFESDDDLDEKVRSQRLWFCGLK